MGLFKRDKPAMAEEKRRLERQLRDDGLSRSQAAKATATAYRILIGGEK